MEEKIFASAFGIYLVGAPIAIGVMVAKGLAAASLFLSLIWPVVALAWFGYWVAS